MASFIKSKDDCTKCILNLLEFSRIIFIHAIERKIAVVNLTVNH